MRNYVFLFALAVLLANGGYALGQLGSGKDKVVSWPLLLGSLGGAGVGLIAVRQRLRDSKKPDED